MKTYKGSRRKLWMLTVPIYFGAKVNTIKRCYWSASAGGKAELPGCRAEGKKSPTQAVPHLSDQGHHLEEVTEAHYTIPPSLPPQCSDYDSTMLTPAFLSLSLLKEL